MSIILEELGELDLMTEVEVAKIVKKSIWWLRKQRHSGEKNGSIIPYRNLGRSVRYDRKDVITWINNQVLRTKARN